MREKHAGFFPPEPTPMFAIAILLNWLIFTAEPLPPGVVARFGSARLRTTANEFALSRDGKTIRTIAGGRTIGRWDSSTGRLLGEVLLEGSTTNVCWFTPDQRHVAIVDPDGIGLYDAETGKRKRTLIPPDPSGMAIGAFSPDGSIMATTTYESDGKGSGMERIHTVPVAGGKSKLLAELPSYVNRLAFSPDGKRLFAAVDNHSLRCWDLVTAKELWKNDHWARHVSVSPDGKILASDTYQDGPLRLWNAETGAAIAKLETGKRSWSRQVTFSPDGTLVGIGTNDAVQIWDVKTEKLLRSFAGAGPNFAFAPDSSSVFTFGHLMEKWDVKTGAPLYPDARAAGHVGPVAHLAFSPDGRFLASTGFDDHTLRIWNRTTGEHKLHKAPVGFPLSYAPDGLLIVPSRAKGAISLIDPETGKEIRTFAFPFRENAIPTPIAARVGADGSTLLALGQYPVAFSRSIEVDQMAPLLAWDLATGKVLVEKTIPVAVPWGGAFSPSGRYLARIGKGDLLNVGTGRSRPLSPTYQPCVLPSEFSADGRWLATVGISEGTTSHEAKGILIHEVLTGRQLLRLERRDSQSLAFSPDGRLLAATQPDALDVFEMPSGKRLLHLTTKGRLTNWNGTQFATCLAFAPDGRSVATGHADGTILLWDMAPAWKASIPPKGNVDPAACWKDLADADPKIAWAAIERMTSDPAAAFRLVNANLKPVVLDAHWVAARIAELSSADFNTRESATKGLKTIGEAAKPLFDAARKTAVTAEGQRRLDELIDYAPAVPGDDAVRSLRALAVLERLGTNEAIVALSKLAGGSSAAELTREAKAALDRLRKR